MNVYIVYIVKTIETEHYINAESEECAKSMVHDYVLNGESTNKIISFDFSEDVRVSDVYIYKPRK